MTTTVTPETKSAPAEAFRFALPVGFADSAGDERSKPNEHRIEIHARRPGVVNHWYWGRICHDMAGIRHKDRFPIDWNHDPDDLLGFVDSVTADESGLSVSGLLQSIKEGDRSAEVIARGRGGQPYEASIYWDECDPVLEYLDAGFVAAVNGQQIEGPCVIAREWTLRGIAITPYGVDGSTHTKFSADGRSDVSVSLRPAEGTMSKDTAPAEVKPTETTSATGEATKDSALVTPAPTQTAPPADATRDAARGELARYMTRFGTERGAEYFRDSVPYESACEREIEHLRKELTTRDSAAHTAEQKLASISAGEAAPVDTGATKDSTKPAGWNSLFKRAG